MSDSQYCAAHWRDIDLANYDVEWEEFEALPDEDIQVPESMKPVSAEDTEAAEFRQRVYEEERTWNDMDLPLDPQHQTRTNH